MESTTLIKSLLSETYFCPHCHSHHIIKNGKEKGTQRYKCKQCGKNFRTSTGTTIHQLHKKQTIDKYMHCLTDGISLRKAAKRCNISLRTAFLWRHRFLAKLQTIRKVEKNKFHTLSALILPYSHKGQKTPIPKNPASITNFLMQNNIAGYIYRSTQKNRIEQLRKINESGIKSFVPHICIPKTLKKSIPIVLKTKPVSTVQQEVELLSWLGHFRGVASKYLHHYWAWYNIQKQLEIANNSPKYLLHNTL